MARVPVGEEGYARPAQAEETKFSGSGKPCPDFSLGRSWCLNWYRREASCRPMQTQCCGQNLHPTTNTACQGSDWSPTGSGRWEQEGQT